MAQSRYINDERKRLNLTISQISILTNRLSKTSTRDTAFMQIYNDLNDLIIKKATIESRIENFGKEKGLLSTYEILKKD